MPFLQSTSTRLQVRFQRFDGTGTPFDAFLDRGPSKPPRTWGPLCHRTSETMVQRAVAPPALSSALAIRNVGHAGAGVPHELTDGSSWVTNCQAVFFVGTSLWFQLTPSLSLVKRFSMFFQLSLFCGETMMKPTPKRAKGSPLAG